MESDECQLFSPYRAIGFVCDPVEIAVQSHLRESFIVAAAGRSYHMYNCSKLKLLFVGPPLEASIECICIWKRLVFAGAGHRILVFSRGKLIHSIPGHRSNVYLLQVVGDYLISVSRDRVMHMWSLKGTQEVARFTPVSTIKFADDFHPVAIVHPATYLNKVLLASEEGTMELWNLRTESLVYRFKGFGSQIASMANSEVLDVVGIGLQDGRIVVHNIKYDKTIVCFHHAEGGGVSSLSFRGGKKPLLASGSSNGQIALWDLENRRLQELIRDSHESGPVRSLHFLPDQPVLISSGNDNSIKMWLINSTEGVNTRLLRFRSGHRAPPFHARFYKNVQQILTAGEDKEFRVFFTFCDRRNTEFSQGHIDRRAKQLRVKGEDLKLSTINSFGMCDLRERDWSNIITCHKDDTHAYLWSFERKAMEQACRNTTSLDTPQDTPGRTGKSIHLICTDPSTTRQSVVRVAMSVCGNYAFLGSESGWLDKYNVQSGIHRGAASLVSKHSLSITGLASDSLNELVISSSLDGKVKFWDFQKMTLVQEVDIGSPVVQLILSRDNDLLVIVSDDYIIRVYDIRTRKLVRRFSGHTNSITDIAMSADSRWLLSSSMDNTVRVWNIVTGTMIDWFKVESSVTSLTMSPSGEFLATTHLGDLGIYLWSNKAYFSNVFLKPPSSNPPLISLPSQVNDILAESKNHSGQVESDLEEDEEEEIEEIEEEQEEDEMLVDVAVQEKDIQIDLSSKRQREDKTGTDSGEEVSDLFPEPIGHQPLATLSNVPRSKLKTFVLLDTVKERNKPKEAPKAPEKAPFFLPTTQGINPHFAPSTTNEGGVMKPNGSRLYSATPGQFETSTPLMRILFSSEEDRNRKALQVLAEMSPSALDLEIRSISNEHLLSCLLELIEFALDSNMAFDLVEAVLNVLLQVHADMILSSSMLQRKISLLQEVHSHAWDRLQELFHYDQSLVAFISGLHL